MYGCIQCENRKCAYVYNTDPGVVVVQKSLGGFNKVAETRTPPTLQPKRGRRRDPFSSSKVSRVRVEGFRV